MPKLTQDQQEALLELRDNDGVRPLLIEIENRVEVMEHEVITASVDNRDELIHRKLRAEGARKLLLDITKILKPEKKK